MVADFWESVGGRPDEVPKPADDVEPYNAHSSDTQVEMFFATEGGKTSRRKARQELRRDKKLWRERRQKAKETEKAAEILKRVQTRAESDEEEDRLDQGNGVPVSSLPRKDGPGRRQRQMVQSRTPSPSTASSAASLFRQKSQSIPQSTVSEKDKYSRVGQGPSVPTQAAENETSLAPTAPANLVAQASSSTSLSSPASSVKLQQSASRVENEASESKAVPADRAEGVDTLNTDHDHDAPPALSPSSSESTSSLFGRESPDSAPHAVAATSTTASKDHAAPLAAASSKTAQKRRRPLSDATVRSLKKYVKVDDGSQNTAQRRAVVAPEALAGQAASESQISGSKASHPNSATASTSASGTQRARIVPGGTLLDYLAPNASGAGATAEQKKTSYLGAHKNRKQTVMLDKAPLTGSNTSIGRFAGSPPQVRPAAATDKGAVAPTRPLTTSTTGADQPPLALQSTSGRRGGGPTSQRGGLHSQSSRGKARDTLSQTLGTLRSRVDQASVASSSQQQSDQERRSGSPPTAPSAWRRNAASGSNSLPTGPRSMTARAASPGAGLPNATRQTQNSQGPAVPSARLPLSTTVSASASASTSASTSAPKSTATSRAFPPSADSQPVRPTAVVPGTAPRHPAGPSAASTSSSVASATPGQDDPARRRATTPPWMKPLPGSKVRKDFRRLPPPWLSQAPRAK